MDSAHQAVLVKGVDLDLHAVAGEVVQDPVELAGHLDHEVPCLEHVREDAAGGGAALEAALEDVGGILADRLVGIEVGIQDAADLVEADQRAPEHSQLRGKADPRIDGDPSDIHQPAPDLHVLQGPASVLCDQV